MKKLLAACSLCLGFVLGMSGCSLGTIVDRFVSTGDVPQEEEPVGNTARVYMDEIRGKLMDFDGSTLTIVSGEQTYVFDVSQATLECADGMITGDEVNIIYEGQLSDTDTSTVHALKVVDEYHKKNKLKDRTAHGQIQSLTANTITIKSKNGKTATYPITGTKQYYQNGIQAGAWVYLHFKGKFPENASNDPKVLNASHLKVLSISDTEPFQVPAPTPTPTPEEAAQQPENEKEKYLRGVIQDIHLPALTLSIDGIPQPVSVNLTSIPCYFIGGAAPGSRVTLAYTGEFNGSTLDGIHILSVTGEDPAQLTDRHMTFTVTGTILATTANTVTIQTYDNAVLTAYTSDARLNLSAGLSVGSNIRITFNPLTSQTSNIYTCLKIEDA